MTFLTSTAGTSGILPAEYASLIIKPVEATAIAFDPRAAETIRTGSHEVRVPRLLSDAASAWVEEGAEIAPSDPTLDEVTITPSKAGGLSIISRELAADSTPGAQDLVGQSLARSIVTRIDEAFVGNLSAPAPKGLGSITPTIVTGDLKNLDVVHKAKAAAAAEGGAPTLLLANPADVLALALIKDQTGSVRALVEDTTSIAGVPVRASRHVPVGTIWLLDSSAIVTVLREDVELAVSSEAFFSSDRVGVRATLRIGLGFVRPEAIVRIDVSA